MNNEMHLQFSALSRNESFARVTVAAFVSQLDPTLDELTEIKTVISEAITNSIIHGYEEDGVGLVSISVYLHENNVTIIVKDNGVGIQNVEEAKQPLFTTKPELERSGMGFTIMENFMDECFIESTPSQGTTIILKKQLVKSTAVSN